MQKMRMEVEELIKQLTTEEKVSLLNGASMFRSVPIERLGIPAIQYLDGGTGINWEQLVGDWAATDTGTVRETLEHFDEPDKLSPECREVRRRFLQKLEEKDCPKEQPGCYPPGILMGATWNPQVVYECGQALGQEALDYQVDILLGTPNVNLLRNPLNGRLFEGYSEEPYLVAALAPELVKGVQESGVLANVKHFAANNLEAYRQAITEGAVLLKNAENALPMKKGSKIAFIGKETAKFHDCGDGSARVVTNKTTSLWKEFAADETYKSVYFEKIEEDDLKDFDYAVVTAFVQGQEGLDRTSLQLPGPKQEEIRTVIREAQKAETKVILVLNVCGPVDLRFCEADLHGILCIFFPGMEGGRGVKDIFTGKINPSGKLPITFPRRLEDCPTYLSVPSPDWTINYGEGLYVGYRYYDKKDIAPLYPFGYGLSYTNFRIEEVAPVCSGEITKEDKIRIRCRITNTGNRDGKEVL